MADLEKEQYKVESGFPGDDSDGADVKRGTVTEAADLYGDEERAERTFLSGKYSDGKSLTSLDQITDMSSEASNLATFNLSPLVELSERVCSLVLVSCMTAASSHV